MKLNLEQIPREKTLSKREFIQKYFKPQKPVVIERFIEDWPAYAKWNLDYMKEIAGDKEVPLYDDRPVNHDEGFNEPHAKMKMADYVELLKSGPTKYRIFLWNILKEVPELQKDFSYPDEKKNEYISSFLSAGRACLQSTFFKPFCERSTIGAHHCSRGIGSPVATCGEGDEAPLLRVQMIWARRLFRARATRSLHL